MTFFFLLLQFSCDRTSSENSQTGSTSEHSELYEKSLNFAQELAKDIATNADLKSELYEKLALKIDGDTEVLLNHLSDNFKSKYTEQISALQRDFLLELRMPLSKLWSIQKIEDAGGLNIVVYPYGKDDRKITEVKGYQSNGNAIKIQKEKAAEKPFLLIAIAERVSNSGKFTFGNLNGVLTNNISFSKVKSKVPVLLDKTEVLYKMKKNPIEIVLNLPPYGDDEYWGVHYCLVNDLPFCGLRYDCLSSPPPPPVPVKDKLVFESFRTKNIDDGWLDGDLEIHWEILQSDVDLGNFGHPNLYTFNSGYFDHDAGTWELTWYLWPEYSNSNKRTVPPDGKKLWSERQNVAGIYNDTFRMYFTEIDVVDGGLFNTSDDLGNFSFQRYHEKIQLGKEFNAVGGRIYIVLKDGN
jgi:hypothetical protein